MGKKKKKQSQSKKERNYGALSDKQIEYLHQRESLKKIKSAQKEYDTEKKREREENWNASAEGKISNAVNKVTGRIERTVHNIILPKKKLLKHPKVSIKKVSGRQLMKSFARTNYPGVGEGRSFEPQGHPEQDKRSLFFQDAYNEEKRRMRFI